MPRSLPSSLPRSLLAALLVLLRLLAPATAMPPGARAATTAFDRLAREAICHAAPGEAGNPAGEAPAGSADCLLCPACHPAPAAVLPVPEGPAVPAPRAAAAGPAAAPPPATGPPGRPRGSAQPTGPPFLSA